MYIDLNADIGEGFGIYRFGQDEAILSVISSANIACGFHAGDPLHMAATVELCLANKVAIGAHPGYPDLAGFGRRDMTLSSEEIKSIIIYQAGALSAIAKSLGGSVSHVKPHGALYNKAAYDEKTANAVIEAVLRLEGPALIALASSPLVQMARQKGLRVYEEGFADRNYNQDGSLVGRNSSDAIISDPVVAADRAVKMVKEKKVISLSGQEVWLEVDTICIHGDNSLALQTANEIKRALNFNGISISQPVRSENTRR